MSTQAQTRIFGVRLGVDPKILVGALIAFAALLFWYNSRGDDSERPPAPVASRSAEAEAAINSTPGEGKRSSIAAQRRRSNNRGDAETLRLKNIDPTHGDVDPQLRLDLLASLERVKLPATSRNLFEEGAVAGMGPNGMPIPVRKIVPTALPVQPAMPVDLGATQLMANIPYKYYGFVKPNAPGEGTRGFFMNGDKVLVGVEGQMLEARYLVVQLSPSSARLEDTQIKKQQTLPVVPQAATEGGSGYGSQGMGMGMQSDASDDMPPDQEPQQAPVRMGPGMGPGMRQPIRGGFVSPNGAFSQNQNQQ